MVTRKVAEFVQAWRGKGDEKQDTQRFWMELLHMVLGVENPARHLLFEKRVKLEDSTRFIDVYIPETKESPTYSITSYSSSYYSQSLMVDITQTRSNGNTTEKELDFDANNYIGDLYSVNITVDDKTLGTYSSWQ